MNNKQDSLIFSVLTKEDLIDNYEYLFVVHTPCGKQVKSGFWLTKYNSFVNEYNGKQIVCHYDDAEKIIDKHYYMYNAKAFTLIVNEDKNV